MVEVILLAESIQSMGISVQMLNKVDFLSHLSWSHKSSVYLLFCLSVNSTTCHECNNQRLFFFKND